MNRGCSIEKIVRRMLETFIPTYPVPWYLIIEQQLILS